jgi:hypothetical protein
LRDSLRVPSVLALMSDAAEPAWPALPAEMQKAIESFEAWGAKHVQDEQDKQRITTTLYHYTDGPGLSGIFESQTLRFTDHRHLNDPSEVRHGVFMAHEVMKALAGQEEGLVQLFLDCAKDLFSPDNVSYLLEYFVACFSREGDDLGQWRAYADNGRGYAIGFAPAVFQPQETPPASPAETDFVGPVLYGVKEVQARYELAIAEAARIYAETLAQHPRLFADKAIGIPSMQQLATALIAQPLIWNALTSKHPAYAHEREVRLVILGMRDWFAPVIKTRTRGSEIVPYIPRPMKMRDPATITEIVLGPATGADAERSVRTMLASYAMGYDSVKIRRSDIPYRPT